MGVGKRFLPGIHIDNSERCRYTILCIIKGSRGLIPNPLSVSAGARKKMGYIMNINGKRVILASKSPRRRELLGKITDSFEIETAEVDETLPSGVHPREGVELLAVRKGAPIAKENPDAIVISSDTLVELDGVALGKPIDEADAAAMLRSLSAKAHNVHTGVAIHYRGRLASGVDSTAVIFREMSDGEISEYIAGGEPMDKAGAYGIQGEGGKFVLGYDGRFDTVMGLSVALVEQLISEIPEVDCD